jgi:DNA-binding phage protein
LKIKLKKYIKWAGGASEVSRQLGLSRTTIWRWQHLGFPDTDFSGKTKHARNLAKICRDNGYSVDAEKVLRAGRP